MDFKKIEFALAKKLAYLLNMNDVKCTLQNSVKNIKKFQEEIHIFTKEDIDNQLSTHMTITTLCK